MMALPASILELLHVQEGSMVGMTFDGSRLIVEAQPRPRHTLAELLAASDYSELQPAEEREWVDAAAVGRETL